MSRSVNRNGVLSKLVNSRDQERYSRQILFPPIAEAGQQLLLNASVAIVGCGALGSFHAALLCRAGIGNLTIIDRDFVEPSNLQRQMLFEDADARAALPKAQAAAQALARINPDLGFTTHIADLNPSNIEELLDGSDLVLDGTDNFETRYLINDYCVREGIPWIYGAAVGSYGITMPVIPGETACLRCIYPNPPTGAQATCETDGVLGAITSTIGALQSADAMRWLVTGSIEARITTVDVWKGQVRQIPQPPRDPQCPTCGLRVFEYLTGSRRAPVSLCGRNAVQIHGQLTSISLQQLAVRLQEIAPVRVNEFALRFFPAPFEMTIFADGRAIIKGTTDVGVARSLYAKYIGS